MRLGISAFCAVTLLASVSLCHGQSTQPNDAVDLAPGFSMRSTGGIDVGGIYCEVVQFGSDWKETEEHDVFNPTMSSPDANTHVASGAFATPSGSFNLTEKVSTADGGIHFAANLSSDKEVQCNELSMAFNLPVALVGGKEVTVDGEQVTLPMEPAKKGEAHLYDKEIAHQIDIPTAAGTLTITGEFQVLLQDDREWGDPRYGLRLQFSPGDGGIKDSKFEMGMKWVPAGKK